MARSHRSSRRVRPERTAAELTPADEAAFMADYDPWHHFGPAGDPDAPSHLVVTTRDAHVATMADLTYDDWEGGGYHVTYS